MPTLSRRQRTLAFSTLAVAALASIATTALEWNLDAHTSLPEVPLQDVVLYQVTVEVSGPVKYPSGELYVDLVANLPEGGAATLRAVMDLDGEVIDAQPQTITVTGSGPNTLTFSALPWQACERGPCEATYLLQVERLGAGSYLTLTGEAHVSVWERGGDASPPDGTEVTIQAYQVVP